MICGDVVWIVFWWVGCGMDGYFVVCWFVDISNVMNVVLFVCRLCSECWIVSVVSVFDLNVLSMIGWM